MNTGIFSSRHNGSHHVTCLVAKKLLGTRGVLHGKTIFVCPAALSSAMTGRLNVQRREVGWNRHTLSRFIDARGINPVRFGITLLGSVVLCATAGTNL
jgi:hypothetical protein